MRHKLVSLREVLVYQLKGLYDAEKQLQSALLKCSKLATEPLRNELDRYTEEQNPKIRRLEIAFDYLSLKPAGRINDVIEELIQETKELLKDTASKEVRDAILIGCAQYMIHYKIAGYGLTASFAHELRLHTLEDILHTSLDEEKKSDKRLTKLAVEEINSAAVVKEYVVHK
jgi:ferritin-like metal-binding protein YciE